MKYMSVSRVGYCTMRYCLELGLTPVASQILKLLKFGIGDGRLRYYLYNWRMPVELQPSEVGLVLL